MNFNLHGYIQGHEIVREINEMTRNLDICDRLLQTMKDNKEENTLIYENLKSEHEKLLIQLDKLLYKKYEKR